MRESTPAIAVRKNEPVNIELIIISKITINITKPAKPHPKRDRDRREFFGLNIIFGLPAKTVGGIDWQKAFGP